MDLDVEEGRAEGRDGKGRGKRKERKIKKKGSELKGYKIRFNMQEGRKGRERESGRGEEGRCM